MAEWWVLKSTSHGHQNEGVIIPGVLAIPQRFWSQTNGIIDIWIWRVRQPAPKKINRKWSSPSLPSFRGRRLFLVSLSLPLPARDRCRTAPDTNSSHKCQLPVATYMICCMSCFLFLVPVVEANSRVDEVTRLHPKSTDERRPFHWVSYHWHLSILLKKTIILLVLQTQDRQTTSQAFQKKIDFPNLVVLLHFFS